MFTARDLHVVAVFSNPRRWKSRSRLVRNFVQHMVESGVSLTLVDHAFGERNHEFDKHEHLLRGVNLVQVRGGADQELWIKEALQKVGVSRLPEDWQYMAVIDADLNFQRSDWAMETLHMLQHHRVGQPWSHAIDLGPDGAPLSNEHGHAVDRSFAAAWAVGDIEIDENYGRYTGRALLATRPAVKDTRNHFGFAWAFRRSAWSGIGGLPDWLVTGAADYFSALAFAGTLVPGTYTVEGGARRLQQFLDRCEEHVKQDIGVVPGLVHHGYHGSKVRRAYMERKHILIESKFDPDLHISYDWQGIPSLIGDNRILRDGLRRMNVMRNEDSSE